jgi:hypothetical protein
LTPSALRDYLYDRSTVRADNGAIAMSKGMDRKKEGKKKPAKTKEEKKAAKKAKKSTPSFI